MVMGVNTSPMSIRTAIDAAAHLSDEPNRYMYDSHDSQAGQLNENMNLNRGDNDVVRHQ